MKKRAMLCLMFTLFLLSALVITGCGGKGGGQNTKRQLKVYNWGDYTDPSVLKSFEQETGIHVVYDTFVTNEDMYVKLKSSGKDYDVAIPSDYMISRMIREKMVERIDTSKLKNYKLVGERFLNASFDPKNEYSVPFMWGTVGIACNTKMVKEKVDSWAVLWDKKYEKQIFMLDSPRDSIGITLKYLGYSLNSGDEKALDDAARKLVEQKPLVKAYVVDDVKDRMIAGEGALAVVWSGDAQYIMERNKDVAYIIPKEGTNIWIDSMVILKGSKNKDAAMAFIDYMMRPDIAKKNVEYIGYATPLPEVQKQLPREVQESLAAYPPRELIENAEFFNDLTENLPKYEEVWTKVKIAQ